MATRYEASLHAIELIKEFEGFSARAYPDPATGGKPWTIGWGSTRTDTGAEIYPRQVITEQTATFYLWHEVWQIQRDLNELNLLLNQNMFDALVSFVYNVGIGNLRKSTLLKLLQAQDFSGAEQEFIKWNKANGKVMAGLTRRRQAEAILFRTPTGY